MPTTPAKRETKAEPVTASGVGDPVAKAAPPEAVEAANQQVFKEREQAKLDAAQATLDHAKESGSSGRVYVTDDDGISRLAATEGQRIPAWAEKMAEKSGGLSNEPKPGPQATA